MQMAPPQFWMLAPTKKGVGAMQLKSTPVQGSGPVPSRVMKVTLHIFKSTVYPVYPPPTLFVPNFQRRDHEMQCACR